MVVTTGEWLESERRYTTLPQDDIWPNGGMDRTEIVRRGFTTSILLSPVWQSLGTQSCTVSSLTIDHPRRTQICWQY